ncbi:MAG: DUF2249 domain-containing protein [Bacteroidetes bacterium]|nr:DUF2249 domain-containing protein [Bacteroidota bacterium]
MTKINAHTKISTLLKDNPKALEAIISLSPKFNKLRNPILRKLMASRTSLAMASKIGGVPIEDFLNKLHSLGFETDHSVEAHVEETQNPLPGFLREAKKESIITLDVRPVIESGKDPFNLIIKTVKQVPQGGILKLINSFEPAPLIPILTRQGFEYYVETVSETLVNTYFFKKDNTSITDPEKVASNGDWQNTLDGFKDQLVTIDVRKMEMPLPMMTILEALEQLPPGKALFVYHKRIPVFLLPELKDRKFEYRINEISEGEVHLLIFKA